jgi:hypothetical protein
MKVVFLGNFGVSYSSENHHKASLEALGHEVVALQEGQTAAEQVQDYARGADLFVWVHTHGWNTPTSHHGSLDMVSVLKRLKAEGIPSLTYHLDLWKGLAREKDLESDSFYNHIEHFFTVDKLMADWFNEHTTVKGHYLPAGVFGPECNITPNPSNYPDDVIFVGSKGYHPEWPYRPELIDWLQRHYGDNFKHYGGDGVGVVRGDTLNYVYSKAKIAIGDTLCKGFNYPYYFSDRVFETTGRGGFIIHPYIKGIEDVFEIDKEIVAYEFENFAELRRKINYYLSHDDEREAIRRAGHERTKRDHTYLKRWETILATVAQS